MKILVMNSKIPVRDKDISNYNSITLKIAILTTNTLVHLYNSNQNRDLKCNRIHYQYFQVFYDLYSLFEIIF